MDRKFLEKVIRQFSLDIHGIHGAEHWIRVHENGFRLAQSTGANTEVILWFALLHDSQRVTNMEDMGHGERAAAWARKHRRDIELDDAQFGLLVEALACHNRGCDPRADITVQTCLDADRLDIGRTGAIVSAAYLYTEAAKRETMVLRLPRRR
jgi:uncharacterized protein